MTGKLALVVALAAVARGSAQDVEVPEFFDTRQQWYGCGLAVMNQGQCGSCWASSATGVFTERMCIHFAEDGTAIKNKTSFPSNRKFQRAGSCTGEGSTHMAHNHGCKRTTYVLSPQNLMSCGTANEDSVLYPNSAGCNGGEALDAWRFFFVKGLSTMTEDGSSGCMPYISGRCAGKDPLNNGCKQCSALNECEDSGLKPEAHRVNSYGFIMQKGLNKRADTSKPRPASEAALVKAQVRAMQVELMTNGPLHACIDYFDNFGGFFNENPIGIYNSTESRPQTGGHCLSVLGWGTDRSSGFDYWIIKNSWGSEWGSEGIFRFIRGQDLCGIESDVWAACPEGAFCELTAGVHRMETRRPTPELLSHPLLDARINELFLNAGRDVQPRRLGQTTSQRVQEIVEVDTSRVPSSTWRGGYWRPLSRDEFSSKPFNLKVAHAYEQAFGEPTSPKLAAEAAVSVTTQAGSFGVKVKAVFAKEDGSNVEVVHVHAPNGHITHL